MAPTSIELNRQYRELSEKDTEEVVEAVADLIVNFLKVRHDPARAGGDGPERYQERDREQSDAR